MATEKVHLASVEKVESVFRQIFAANCGDEATVDLLIAMVMDIFEMSIIEVDKHFDLQNVAGYTPF